MMFEINPISEQCFNGTMLEKLKDFPPRLL